VEDIMKKWLNVISVLCIWVFCLAVCGQTPPAESKRSGLVIPKTRGSDSLAFINKASFLEFTVPPDATPEQKILAANIMDLDHRAHNELGPGTPEWKEVLGMLTNAANVGLTFNESSLGDLNYGKAKQAFLRHIETKNRVKYLYGVMLGAVVGTLLSGLLYLIAMFLAEPPFITPKLLPLLCLFAGIGSLTSVLTRLNTIDLKQETATQLILASGACSGSA
jgi:hypothetical protein